MVTAVKIKTINKGGVMKRISDEELERFINHKAFSPLGVMVSALALELQFKRDMEEWMPKVLKRQEVYWALRKKQVESVKD